MGTVETDNRIRLRTGQAARRVGLSDTQIKLYCTLGEIEYETTPGGHRRIFQDSLDAWFAERAADNERRRVELQRRHFQLSTPPQEAPDAA